MNERKTNLAWRLSPGTEQKSSLESPGLLVTGSGAVVSGLVLLPVDWKVALLLGLSGVALCFVAFVKTDEPKDVEPLKGGTEGYLEATAAIRRSPDEEERKHTFLGTVYGTMRKVPFLLHEKLARMHILILGASGTMKTWRTVMSICWQLLDKGNRSLVYIDHSGDESLLWALQRIAKKNKMKFAFFSLNPNKASHLLQLFDDPAFVAMTPNEKAQTIAQAGGMDSGDGYATGYYCTVIERLMRGLFKFIEATGEVITARLLRNLAVDREMRKRLSMTRRDYENTTHAANVFDKLAEDPRMNITGTEEIPRSLFEHAIRVNNPIKEPTIYLLDLSMLQEPTTARFVSRFFIRAFCSSISKWKGPRVEHVYICVDEFGEMVHSSLETPLRQIRKFGASMILVFQNLSDLRKHGEDFTDLVLNNTAVKVMMSAKDLVGRSYITSTGGEVIRETTTTSKTETTTQLGKSVSVGKQVREDWVPRFDANLLNEVNANADLVIVEAYPNEGFTKSKHPIIVETAFPFTKEQFDSYQELGWPAADNVRSILAEYINDPEPVAPPPVTPPPAQPHSSPSKRRRPPKPVDPDQAKRAAAIAAILRQAGGNTNQ